MRLSSRLTVQLRNGLGLKVSSKCLGPEMIGIDFIVKFKKRSLTDGEDGVTVGSEYIHSS